MIWAKIPQVPCPYFLTPSTRVKWTRNWRVRNLQCIQSTKEIIEFRKKSRVRQDYDAICVLGGGYESTGALPPWVVHRLDLSQKIFSLQSPSCALVCVGGGTPHKPPILTPSGYPIHESTLLAQHLLKNGVPAENILKETSSYDTVGNAYFVLTIHAIPAQWRRLAIITSKFHMQRASALFADIFHLASHEFNLEFFAAKDDQTLTSDALSARLQREADSLKAWKQNLTKLKSLSDVHHWLHKTHLCYSVSRQHEFGINHLGPATLGSY